MKYYLEEIFHSNKKIILLTFVISCLAVFLNLKVSSSKKDLLMLFLAMFLLLNDIYLIFVSKKKSILLFIISLPFLVTARKFVQMDFFIFKISFETIYVTILFMLNIKEIFNTVKLQFLKGNKKIYMFYILLFIFIILVYNSNMYSVYFWKSMSDTYLGVVTPIMFMLAVIAIIGKEDVDKILYASILSINLSCLYGFLQIFKDGISLTSINKNRGLLTFGYHNVNIFAGILVTIIPILLNYILYNKNTKREKIFLYLSFIIQFISLAITFTRGAWLSAALAIFLIFISKKYKKIVIVMIILGIVLMKPALSFVITRGNTTGTFLNNESAVARLQSIYTDAAIIKDYPLGVGMSAFPEYYKEFATRGYLMMPDNLRWSIKAAHYMLEHAHNLLLQIGVEFGIISLITYLLIIVNRIKVAFNDYAKNRGLFVSLITYIFFSTITGNEFNHKGVITGTLIIFLILGLLQINNFTLEKDSMEV